MEHAERSRFDKRAGSSTNSKLNVEDEKRPLCPNTDQSNDDTNTKEESDKSDRRRLIRTVCMAPIFLTIGLYGGAMPPAVPDLLKLLECNVAQLSHGLMLKSVGCVLGSLCGALVSDHYRKHADLSLFVATFLAGLIHIIIPWAPNIPCFAILRFVFGVTLGVQNVVCCTVVIKEWEKKSTGPVIFIQMFLPVGKLVAPGSIAPFLSQQVNSNMTSNWTTSSRNAFSDNIHVIVNQVNQSMPSITYVDQSIPSRIYIPFAIHGLIGIVVASVFLMFYLWGWQYKAAASKEDRSQQLDGLSKKAVVMIAIVIFFLYTIRVSGERPLSLFNYYIIIQVFDITNTSAAFYNTVFTACLILGQAATVILTNFLSVHWLLFSSVFLALLTDVMILLFALESVLLFGVLTCLFNVWYSPIYPCMVTWLNEYKTVSGKIMGTIELGQGLGGVLAVWIAGEFLQALGPVAIFLQSLVATVGVAALLVSLQLYFVTAKLCSESQSVDQCRQLDSDAGEDNVATTTEDTADEKTR